MREIKFRAWVTSFSSVSHGHPPTMHYKETAWTYLMSKAMGAWMELMQFTGQLDKNGSEIYEGDILTVPNGGICSVIWNEIGFAVLSPGSEAIDVEYSNFYGQSEVIGNIYENPELLQ